MNKENYYSLMISNFTKLLVDKYSDKGRVEDNLFCGIVYPDEVLFYDNPGSMGNKYRLCRLNDLKSIIDSLPVGKYQLLDGDDFVDFTVEKPNA